MINNLWVSSSNVLLGYADRFHWKAKCSDVTTSKIDRSAMPVTCHELFRMGDSDRVLEITMYFEKERGVSKTSRLEWMEATHTRDSEFTQATLCVFC